MFKPLNWGFLGSARINVKTIVPISHSSDHRLRAIGSRDIAKATAYAAEWGFEKAYGSYEDLLEDPEVDVIYNSLPNHLHTEWTLKAIRHGKHVLCEKPICLKSSDVDLIKHESEDRGVCVTEGFMYRHHPRIRKIKNMILEGDLGQVLRLKVSHHFMLQGDTNIRLDPALGGGALADLGCYAVNIMRFLTGHEPIRVSGQCRKSLRGADTFFCGQLHFPNDILGDFDCGFHSPRTASMEIIGTKAILRVPEPFRVLHPHPGDEENLMFLQRESGIEEIRTPHPESPHLTQIQDLARAIRDKGKPLVSLEDSRGNSATLEALARSAGIES